MGERVRRFPLLQYRKFSAQLNHKTANVILGQRQNGIAERRPPQAVLYKP